MAKTEKPKDTARVSPTSAQRRADAARPTSSTAKPGKTSGGGQGNLSIERGNIGRGSDAAVRTGEHKGPGLKVQATAMGYFDHVRRRPGDVFVIPREPVNPDTNEPAAFSRRWMRHAEDDLPLRVTTPNQAIKAQHDEVLGEVLQRQINDPGTQSVAHPAGGTNVLPPPGPVDDEGEDPIGGGQDRDLDQD